MKLYIYTMNEKASKNLKEAKNMAMHLFPDAEVKTGIGKPRKNSKNEVSFDEFKLVALEDFWKSEVKPSALALCDLLGVGISERVIERL